MHMFGGLSVIHLFSSTVLWCLPRVRECFFLPPWDSAGCSNGRLQPYIGPFAFCEYDNGYLVFDREDGAKEVWRLASDFAAEGEVATHAPPDKAQMDMSARAATVFHQYAPRGHFRPWALLRSPADARTYRLAYPTLICVSSERAFLYDVRPGSLVQTIDIRFRIPCYVDVNERHAFMCEPDAVHVFSRESGTEVLCIPVDVTARCSQRVEDPVLVSGDWFITPISVSPRLEVDKSRPLPDLIAGVFTHTLWFTQRFRTHTSHSPCLQGRP